MLVAPHFLHIPGFSPTRYISDIALLKFLYVYITYPYSLVHEFKDTLYTNTLYFFEFGSLNAFKCHLNNYYNEVLYKNRRWNFAPLEQHYSLNFAVLLHGNGSIIILLSNILLEGISENRESQTDWYIIKVIATLQKHNDFN